MPQNTLEKMIRQSLKSYQRDVEVSITQHNVLLKHLLKLNTLRGCIEYAVDTVLHHKQKPTDVDG
jgi:hypothetical protein